MPDKVLFLLKKKKNFVKFLLRYIPHKRLLIGDDNGAPNLELNVIAALFFLKNSSHYGSLPVSFGCLPNFSGFNLI